VKSTTYAGASPTVREQPRWRRPSRLSIGVGVARPRPTWRRGTRMLTTQPPGMSTSGGVTSATSSRFFNSSSPARGTTVAATMSSCPSGGRTWRSRRASRRCSPASSRTNRLGCGRMRRGIDFMPSSRRSGSSRWRPCGWHPSSQRDTCSIYLLPWSRGYALSPLLAWGMGGTATMQSSSRR